MHKSLSALVLLFGGICTEAHSQANTASVVPVSLETRLSAPFEFVVYGDTRFTDPNDTKASSPTVRRMLVQAIDDAHPAFISITGDISYNGNDPNDWKVWDEETTQWRNDKIPLYPALGNHDLHGDVNTALGNYFARFPELNGSRYYSVRAANTLTLVLDSSLDELSGPQGSWLSHELGTMPADVDFVLVILHHPPYTSSSDAKQYGGGHSARMQEGKLAEMLEARQQVMHARIVVFAGHVHNYERHEHGGITYFVTGGGGAHAYPIERASGDPYQSNELNYHYLFARVEKSTLTVVMNRLDMSSGKPVWSQPDRIEIAAPARVPAVSTAGTP